MDIYRRVGNRIADLRVRHGVTQEELAEAVGISASYVARIEGGAKRPALDILERIAGALTVSIVEVVTDAPPSTRRSRYPAVIPALARAAASLPPREQRLLVAIARRFAAAQKLGLARSPRDRR